MNSEQYYYRPKPQDPNINLAREHAWYLIDNGFVKLDAELTEEILIERIASTMNDINNTIDSS